MRSFRLSFVTAAATAAAVLVPLAPPAAAVTAFVPDGVAVVVGQGNGDGRVATEARIDPKKLVYAPNGDLLVVEATRLRRIDAESKVITTIAGTGVRGLSGDGGPATAATFASMRDVAVADDGTMYIAENGNSRIRRIAPDGTVSTLVTVASPVAVELSPSGVLYVAQSGAVSRWTGTALERVAGGGSTNAATVGDARNALLYLVTDIAFTPNGHLILSETYTHRVRRVLGGVPGASITTLLGNPPIFEPWGLASRPDGSVAILSHDAIRVLANAGGATPGPLTTVGTSFSFEGVAADAAGHLVEMSHGYPDGWTVRTLPGGERVAGARFAADGAPVEGAWFQWLRDVAVGADGTAYVVDDSLLRTVSPGGVLGTLAGSGAVGPRSGIGGPAKDAVFEDLRQAAPAPGGDVYVADGPYVRKVVPGGAITAFAQLDSAVTGLAVAADGAVHAVTACHAYTIQPDGTTSELATPAACTLQESDSTGAHRSPTSLLDVTLDADGRPLLTRNVSGEMLLHRVEPDGTLTLLEKAPLGTGVAVRPDGTVELAAEGLLPDGGVVRRSYVVDGTERRALRLAAEPSGTLLAIHEDRTLLRLTPRDQAMPPAVTGLQVTPGPGSLTLSWDAVASDELTGYVVAIRRGTTPPATPRLGEGSGVVVPVGTTTVTLTRAGLVDGYPGLNDEPYSVAVFARGGSGVAAPAVATATPLPETVPPGTGSDLAFTVEDGLLKATWTKPGDADLYRAVARLAPTTPPATADAGTGSTDVGLGVAYWSIASLPQGTYGVSVFHEDLYGNRSAPLSGTVFVDRTPPAPVTGLTASQVISGAWVKAAWTAPGADVKYVRARLLTGYTYPATPDQGLEPTTSSRGEALWPITYYGAQHRIAVFTTDTAGNTSRATYLFVPRRPVRLTIAVPATVRYGEEVLVRGSIVKPDTGSGYNGQRVELWARPRFGTAPFRFVSALTSNQYGRVAYRHAPSVEMQYQLRHPASTVAAATSGTAVVGVVPEVLSNPRPSRLARNAPFTMYAGLDPGHVGVALTLQRYYGGAWHDVVTRYTASDGIARLPGAAPGTAGTHYFRVVFRGDRDHRPAVGFHYGLLVS
ncbi:MAG TPA: hypothetical protein VGX28_15360 [Frankiaceae bacterium]|jgi:hypothetical protein|nr:hypothetical protein [Frankiaceae bacterium]